MEKIFKSFLPAHVKVFIHDNKTYMANIIGKNEETGAELYEFDESVGIRDKDRELAEEMFPTHVLKENCSYYIQQGVYTNVLPPDMVLS